MHSNKSTALILRIMGSEYISLIRYAGELEYFSHTVMKSRMVKFVFSKKYSDPFIIFVVSYL